MEKPIWYLPFRFVLPNHYLCFNFGKLAVSFSYWIFKKYFILVYFRIFALFCFSNGLNFVFYMLGFFQPVFGWITVLFSLSFVRCLFVFLTCMYNPFLFSDIQIQLDIYMHFQTMLCLLVALRHIYMYVALIYQY